METTGPTLSLSSRDLPIEAVRLEVTEGPAKGAHATLDQGTLILGSSSRADLTLDDPTVSRRHASFELVRGGVRVSDLDSHNGVQFLGARVNSVVLTVGLSVTLGRSTVRIAPLVAKQQSAHTERAGLIAHSLSMRHLLWRVERTAVTDAAVVISGPTGAGKEVVARALHQLSPRAKEPLEFFDCASARGELLESELFGHVRGAFTGATSDRAGLVELAHRGTLVLDNVDQLPLDLQTRLLRLLENHSFRRVGATHTKTVSLRIIATTQRPLELSVSEGRVRPDVYYRLAEVLLEVPPLAERLDDIPLLASAFANSLAKMPITLSKATVAALQAHPWPGNARELKNAVARCLAFGRFDQEKPGEEQVQQSSVDLKDARARVVQTFEADFLRALLKKHGWNVSAAAKDAKVARSHLYTLVARHGLKRT